MNVLHVVGGSHLPKKILRASPVLGAIIGDYVGSIYEFNNIKTKEFDFFDPRCMFTDDTVLTVAVFSALNYYYEQLDKDTDSFKCLGDITVHEMVKLCTLHPKSGYGVRFFDWLYSMDHKPYKSIGNGAAMRISPVTYFSRNIEESVMNAKTVTDVTHNTREANSAAECITIMTSAALQGYPKYKLREIAEKFYNIDFTLDSIRYSYRFSEICRDTVPQAIVAFLESTSYEDAIRNAISIGGDSDTIACITGTLAGAYYHIPDEFVDHIKEVMSRDYPFLYEVVEELFN